VKHWDLRNKAMRITLVALPRNQKDPYIARCAGLSVLGLGQLQQGCQLAMALGPDLAPLGARMEHDHVNRTALPEKSISVASRPLAARGVVRSSFILNADDAALVKLQLSVSVGSCHRCVPAERRRSAVMGGIWVIAR
jgi:hypothetical protein